jgi:hypothetical protein
MSNIDDATNMSLAYKAGLWSAIITTVLVIVAGITATAAVQPLATIVGFLVAPTFVVLTACIYSTAPTNRRFLGIIGLSFALMYGTLISFNYYADLTFVHRGVFDVEVFNMLNPNSIFWVIELLGYFFMGLSTLFTAFVFVVGKLEKAIRCLFILNGVLGVGGLMGYALNLSITLLLGGLIIWDIVIPLSTALIAYRFKNKITKYS